MNKKTKIFPELLTLRRAKKIRNCKTLEFGEMFGVLHFQTKQMRNMRHFRHFVRQQEEKVGSFSGMRFMSNSRQERNKSFALYLVSVAVGVVGLSYAAVPLYKVFCQATGYGGTTQIAGEEAASLMRPVKGARPLKIRLKTFQKKSFNLMTMQTFF